MSRASNGAAHLSLSGPFDSAAIPALDDLIGETRSRDVVLDLSGITFMDSVAWLAVMAYEHRAADGGKAFRLVNTPVHIRRIFELTSTDYLLADAGGTA